MPLSIPHITNTARMLLVICGYVFSAASLIWLLAFSMKSDGIRLMKRLFYQPLHCFKQILHINWFRNMRVHAKGQRFINIFLKCIGT